MARGAFICGLAGPELEDDERRFLAEARPWGVILFTRNVDTLDGVRRLTDRIREVLGDETPVLIDQEGGRVQRIAPPHLPAYPPARAFGALFDVHPAAGVEAVELCARLIADDLLALGIDMNCLPLLDLPAPGATSAIGSRAFGSSSDMVVALGRAQARGLLEGGVRPIMKHVPGHGRARVDSHFDLPVVEDDLATLRSEDFVPFQALAREMPFAMTAHIVFTAIDPDRPATLSPAIVRIIRQDIGFSGALMTDDVSMQALTGGFEERARGAREAGCDLVLHCNGNMAEMEAVAKGAGTLEGAALRRCRDGLAGEASRKPLDRAAAVERLVALTGGRIAA